ncbi:hypothetical protein Q5H93_06705 [Hymenobacter sp. ASUV-10]|uniref:Carboxypeptidase-like regulatory domain-containing protein n=1 Tax=Hymenobacter aranciens TaxID=3063996 RepID=A0ABT9B806_9BACT|nr:hypothetical protein [Hymenobacter sp. ASUV-10]MDO7874417.1 hypothetical protein [Hymenobacter sp. ASUV-10]
MKTTFQCTAGFSLARPVVLLLSSLLLTLAAEAATIHTRPATASLSLGTERPAAKPRSAKPAVRTASRRLPARKVMVVEAQAETAVSNYCWGQVLGPDHRPLPGACVFVAGQPGIIAATNSEGKFRLRLSASAAQTLTVAYAGLRDQQVPVANTLAKNLVIVSLQR